MCFAVLRRDVVQYIVLLPDRYGNVDFSKCSKSDVNPGKLIYLYSDDLLQSLNNSIYLIFLL